MKWRKHLQKKRELNELKSKFVNLTSHEFRTPLTTIKAKHRLSSAQFSTGIPRLRFSFRQVPKQN